MKKIICCMLLLASGNLFSQKDHLQVVAGLNLGQVFYETNEIFGSEEFYNNLSWNYDGIVHNTNFGSETKTYTCNTILFHAGVSVPFARIGRVSFGVEPKFGIGVFQSNEKVDHHDLTANKKELKSFTIDGTGFLYMRCKLGEKWHLSLLGGYRVVRSYYNYGAPAVGLEFGQEFWRIGVYAYRTTIRYNRELSNGELQPTRLYRDLGSVSLYFCLGKKVKEENKTGEE